MKVDKWIKNNCGDLSGKTVAITGSTGGLGRAVCRHLARLSANLILLDRDLKYAEEQKAELLELNKNINIEIIELELTNFNSVKDATEKLKTIPFNMLILNAGAYNIPIKITDLGYNNIFQINFVSQYYMVKELLPVVREQENCKVIAVGSIAHNYSKINTVDIDFSREKKASKIYGNSKRFLMFSLYELFKGEKKIELSIVHPGITYTKMTSHYPKAINWLVKGMVKILFPPVERASLNILAGVFNSCGYHEWIGPKSCNIWGKPKKKKLKTCSKTESEKIFNIAEDIYKKISKI